MSLFDQIVSDALRYSESTGTTGLSGLRPAVEKEILHHDILQILSDGGFLKQLIFIGGTCLRLCYGSNRLSEDLDFATESIDHQRMNALTQHLKSTLGRKYALPVSVGEPTEHQQAGEVSTWKIRITTAPERPDLRQQRINLDICAVPAHDIVPRPILSQYGIELPTSNLVIRAESREEIFTDKIIALALRPGRIKHRDLWDMTWLTQQEVKPALHLLPMKLRDRQTEETAFTQKLSERARQIRSNPELPQAFDFEMRRFVPPGIASSSLDNADFWPYVQNTVTDICTQALNHLKNGPKPEASSRFTM